MTKGDMMEEQSVEVREYEKPAVVDLGDLRELTESGLRGSHLDGTYGPSDTVTFIFS